MASDNMITSDVSRELYREIVMISAIGTSPDGTPIMQESVYRIDKPVTQFIRKGGVTQRIVDAAGIVHLVPGPGYRGAVHRWKPVDSNEPVQF